MHATVTNFWHSGQMAEITTAENTPEVLDYACPRCEAATTARFYGPCPACRIQLKAAYADQARDVEVEEYEPKMNVTPNAVATKD